MNVLRKTKKILNILVLAPLFFPFFSPLLWAQSGSSFKILHTPPDDLNYPDSLEISVQTSEPVRVVKFFFLRPGMEDYQLRILRRDDDGHYRYHFDTSTLMRPELKYYFEVKKDGTRFYFPKNAPQKVIALKGIAKAPLPDKDMQPPANLPPQIVIKDKLPLDIHLDGSARYEIDTHGNGQSPFNQDERFVIDGNVSVSKRYQKENLKIDFDSNVTYANRPFLDYHRVSLSNVLFSLHKDQHTIKVGDVTINGSKFTLMGLGRRGAEYQFKGQSGYFQVFNINSQQKNGWVDFVPESKTNIYGGAFGLSHFDKRFSLKTVYLAGNDDPGEGDNVAGTALQQRKGRVFALIPEMSLFEHRLKLIGEYAFSKYDGNLSDDSGMESDNAWRIGGAYSHGPFLFEANYQHTGDEFDSIGNQNAILFESDRQGYDLSLGLSLAKSLFTVSYLFEEDNVDDDRSRPTSEIKNVTTELLILPTDRLTLRLGYHTDEQEAHQDAGRGALMQNKDTDDYSFGLDYLLFPTSSIHFGVTHSRIESRTDLDAESSTFTTSLGGSFQFGDRLVFNPEVSYSETEFDMTDSTTKTYNAFLDAEYFILPRILSVSTVSSYTKTDADDLTASGGTSLHSADINLAGNVNLYLGKFFPYLSRSVLSLKGGYVRSESDTETTDSRGVAVQFDWTF